VQYAARVSLRERKRERTRQALVDAALELFERYGYEETTVAEIAAKAEVGTRTFFNYFPTKEDLLFPEHDLRVRTTLAAIENRTPDETPAEVLLRALQEAGGADSDLVSRLGALRLRLARIVPAVRARGLQGQFDAQRAIAEQLRLAFPELDAVDAAALVGAFVGAITGALAVLMEQEPVDDLDEIRERLRTATERALNPWVSR
jgi:AcrR family transcriptional regulator